MQWRSKTRLLTCKIRIKPCPSAIKHTLRRRILRGKGTNVHGARFGVCPDNGLSLSAIERGSKVLLVLKPKTGKTLSVSREQDITKRRMKRRRKHRPSSTSSRCCTKGILPLDSACAHVGTKIQPNIQLLASILMMGYPMAGLPKRHNRLCRCAGLTFAQPALSAGRNSHRSRHFATKEAYFQPVYVALCRLRQTGIGTETRPGIGI